MNAIQIIALLFVLWMTYFSFLHYRHESFPFGSFLFGRLYGSG